VIIGRPASGIAQCPSRVMEHVQRVLSVVESGSEEALRGLLREGGKVDVCDEEGSSSLLYAAAHGWEDIVRMLLKV